MPGRHRDRVSRALALIVVAAVVAGCARDNPDAPRAVASGADGPRTVTFNTDIAPILFENCASCHRPIDATTGPRFDTDGRGASADDPIDLA